MTLRELQIKLLNYDDLEHRDKKKRKKENCLTHKKGRKKAKECRKKLHQNSIVYLKTRLNRSRRQKIYIFDTERGNAQDAYNIHLLNIFHSIVQSCCCIRKSHKTMMMMEMKFIFLSGHEISFHKISRDCSLSFLFADFFIKNFHSLVGVSQFLFFFAASCCEDGKLS